MSMTAARPKPTTAGFLARRITRFTVVLFLLGFGGIAVLMAAAAQESDRVAIRASRTAVQTALASLERVVATAVGDEANWDEAVVALHEKFDPLWAEKYLGPLATEPVRSLDRIVLSPDNRVVYAYTPSCPALATEAAGDAALHRFADEVRLADDELPAIGSYLRLCDTVYYAAGGPLRYIDLSRTPARARSSVLLFAKRLEGAGLVDLQAQFALTPLALTGSSGRAGEQGRQQSLPLTDAVSGEPVGFITWRPELPAQNALRAAALPVAGLSLAMLTLLVLVTLAARRAGRALDVTNEDLQQAHATLEQTVVERTAALREAEARLRDIFENAGEGIFQIGDDGRYLSANPAMAAIFGYGSVEAFLAEATDHSHHDDERWQQFRDVIEAFGRVSDFVSKARRRDGRTIWISQNARMVRQEGEPVWFEGMLSDITHRKRIEEQLIHDALHDALTGLPNRRAFEERLVLALARHPRQGVAVLLIDCNRFKLINDSLGHAVGDELLVALAQRLSLCMRRADTLARLGGDEFAVLVEDGEGTPLRLAERLEEACRRPFVLHGRDVFLSLSIGAAVSGDETVGASELLRNADIAMYQAKAQGVPAALFEPSMHASVVNRMRVENELRAALEADHLHVLYQPIIGLNDGQIAGFEALVRWRHPERGVITPDQFIPIAEESGMIRGIGEVVLRKATAEMAGWLQRAACPRSLFLAVNLSPVQLKDDRIAQRIGEILTENGLTPQRLKLEITETAIMTNPADARHTLAALDAMGVRFCIDDFGTGQSSLSQLHTYRFDTLKIDRSFISQLVGGENAAAIVRSVLMLADNLRMTVVAEGVEEPGQREWLRAHGCGFAQGWLFAPALDAAAAEELLQASARSRAA